MLLKTTVARCEKLLQVHKLKSWFKAWYEKQWVTLALGSRNR